jgi:hypothetical protein
MGELPTARDYVNVHRVDGVCLHCDRWQELDLAAIIAAGQGDLPLIHLPLRCSACGRTGHRVKVSGRSYGLAESGSLAPTTRRWISASTSSA